MPIREYYQAHKEKMRAYSRKYRAENPELYRKYSAGKAELYREYWRKGTAKYLSKEGNREKDRARSTARNRRIPKQPCSVSKCPETTKVERHHEDYNKPLDVIWFCKRHHEDHHHGERLS